MIRELFRKICAHNDQRRARIALQDICDERVIARRRAAQLDRDAERALRDAVELEREHFREEFFGRRNPVRAGFVPSAASLFGIKTPTPFRGKGSVL